MCTFYFIDYNKSSRPNERKLIISIFLVLLKINVSLVWFSSNEWNIVLLIKKKVYYLKLIYQKRCCNLNFVIPRKLLYIKLIQHFLRGLSNLKNEIDQQAGKNMQVLKLTSSMISHAMSIEPKVKYNIELAKQLFLMVSSSNFLNISMI